MPTSSSLSRRAFLHSSLFFLGVLAALPGCKDAATSNTASTGASGASGSTNNQTSASTSGPSSVAGGQGGAAAAPYDANQPEIKIGAYFSLTGATATFGRGSVNGINLAFDEINAKGGVLGKPLKLIAADTSSKAEQAALVVNKLIYQEKYWRFWAKSRPRSRWRARRSARAPRCRWSRPRPPTPP